MGCAPRVAPSAVVYLACCGRLGLHAEEGPQGRSSLLQAEQVGTTMISCADLEAFAKRANLIPAAKQPLPNAPAGAPILLSALSAVAQVVTCIQPAHIALAVAD